MASLGIGPKRRRAFEDTLERSKTPEGYGISQPQTTGGDAITKFNTGAATPGQQALARLAEDSAKAQFDGTTNDWAKEGTTAWGKVTGYGDWDHSDPYKQVYGELLDYKPFEYDYAADPLYDVYKKEYTREGRRASDDALAKLSARTGGLASSYAGTVGNQAYLNYMQELANKIPELRQQAYNEWQGNFNNLLSKYNAAYNNDNFDYGVYGDKYNRLLGQRDFAFGRADTDYGRAMDAAALRAQLGDMGGYDNLFGTDLQGLYDTQKGEEDESRAVYAFGDDGGDPYRITSLRGLNWLQNLPEGVSVQGGDGSIWTRKDGQIVITTRDGKTYRYGTATPTQTWSGYYTGPDDDDDKPRTEFTFGDGLDPRTYAADRQYLSGLIQDGEYAAIEKKLDDMRAEGISEGQYGDVVKWLGRLGINVVDEE